MYELNENGEILVDNLTVFIPQKEINMQEFNKDALILINIIQAIKKFDVCLIFPIVFITGFLEIEKVRDISAILFISLLFLVMFLLFGGIMYMSRKYNCSTRNFKYSEKSNFRTNKNQ